MISRLLATSAIAAALAGTSVNADTLSFDEWRFGSGTTVNTNIEGNVLAGEFVMENETEGTSFLAYCIDLLDNLVTADFGLLDPDDRIKDGLQGLYTNHYASVVDRATSASFQLAIWEIVYEESGTYALGDGDFSSSTAGSIADDANDWLGDLVYDTAGYSLTFWDGSSATTAGDRISQDLVSATPVPLPASALLLLGGLGGLFAARGRKKSA